MKLKQNGIFIILIALLILGCKNAERKTEKESENFDSYVLVNDWPNL